VAAGAARPKAEGQDGGEARLPHFGRPHSSGVAVPQAATPPADVGGATEGEVGFGRIIVSDTAVPNLLVNLV
jgi:hypothetical protein